MAAPKSDHRPTVQRYRPIAQIRCRCVCEWALMTVRCSTSVYWSISSDVAGTVHSLLFSSNIHFITSILCDDDVTEYYWFHPRVNVDLQQ